MHERRISFFQPLYVDNEKRIDRYVAYRWNCAPQYETLHTKMKKARRSKGRFAKPPVYGSY
jgi:hypothetical protein